MDDGRAGNVCDRTTTGTTSTLSLIKSSRPSIAALRVANRAESPRAPLSPGYDNEGTWNISL
jgi:hypothetical protein